MDLIQKVKETRDIIFDAESLFDEEFSREILNSERLRVTFLSGIFIATAAWLIIVTMLFPDTFPAKFYQLYMGLTFRTWLVLAFVAVAVYDFLVRLFIGYLIRYKKQFPVIARYMNAFVETSLPTLSIFIASRVYNPITALYVPTTFFYFIFIFLSALRLHFRLCLFTGIVAAVEYTAVAMIIIDQSDNISYLNLQSIGQHIGRGLLLLLGGLVTGFVAVQIKKRIMNSYENIDERMRIVNMFGQHVSPEVVNKLLEQRTDTISEMRYVCVMFLDIRNFTGFTEGRNPEEVIGYLNNLFDFMIDIINSNSGIINKFLGDGFMAVFGAPISDGRDSLNAVNASLEIIERLKSECELNRIAPTKIGIGLHAGEVVTGNVGSSVRKEYTIIGDVVNLSSRIEQLNKKYKSQLLVSDEVLSSMGGYAFKAESLGMVTVKGRKEPVHIYRLA